MTDKGVSSSEAQQEPAAVDPEFSDKRSRRGKWATVTIILVVIILLSVSFAIWHEQPSFCNSVCHTPMDSYVEGYLNDDDTKLVSAHKASGSTCLTCHPARINEQATEAAHWASGNYAYDEASEALLSRSGEFATPEFCLNENCHDFSLDELSEATEGRTWNPHDFAQHGLTNCGDCHKMHGQSVLVCSECHYQAADDVPDGWTNIPYREIR